MVALETLEDAARQAFLSAYDQQAQSGRHRMPVDHCPVLLVLHKLLALVEEFHDRPVDEFRPLIRKVVDEEMSVLESSHSPIPGLPSAKAASDLEHQVEMILTALEQVRQMGIDQGRWSSAPLTEQWCG